MLNVGFDNRSYALFQAAPAERLAKLWKLPSLITTDFFQWVCLPCYLKEDLEESESSLESESEASESTELPFDY